MTKEYIEREAALKALNEAIRHRTWSMDDKDVMYQMIDSLEKVPIVEADIDELKKEVADLNNRRHLIWAIGHDYDGCNRVESLKELIDELVSYTQLPREQVPDRPAPSPAYWVLTFECHFRLFLQFPHNPDPTLP